MPIHSEPDVDEIQGHLQAAGQVVERIAGMLEGLASTSVMVPRSEWSVGEHGAHLAFANIGFGMFAMGVEYPYGDGTQSGLAQANEESLMGFPERDGKMLADHLRQGVQNFSRVAAAGSPDQQCPSPLGPMPLGVLTSYFLIHNLMHGCAISAGLNQDFPFEVAHFPLVWPMVMHRLPSFVNAQLSKASGCTHLVADGGFESYLEVSDETLAVRLEPTGAVDCLVESEPVHLFLVLIKMLTVTEATELGHLKVSGTDPDLFARQMRAIDVP